MQFENIQNTGQYSTGFEHLSINHELEMSEEIKKEDTMPEDTPLNEEKSSGTDTAHGSKKDKKKKPDHKEAKAREWHDKFNELNDKYLRLYSEFDNYRKRTQKERKRCAGPRPNIYLTRHPANKPWLNHADEQREQSLTLPK